MKTELISLTHKKTGREYKVTEEALSTLKESPLFAENYTVNTGKEIGSAELKEKKKKLSGEETNAPEDAI